MTSTYRFRLSRADDDAQLRQVLRSVGLPGSMELAAHREPDFFRGEALGSLSSQVIICESSEGRIVGFGVRSLRRAFLDGRSTRVSYFSLLRAYPDVRRGLLLARAHQFVRQLEDDDPVAGSYTTIYDENVVARSILTSGRAGLPAYRPIGALRTFAINLRRKRSPRELRTLTGLSFDPAVLTAHVNRYNAGWQFAPAWDSEDLSGVSGRTDGLRREDFRVVTNGSTITATCGVWDPSSVKQVVVNGYRWPLTWYQPASAWLSRFNLGPYLPPVRGQLRLLYAAGLSTATSDPSAFLMALDDLVADWSGRGYDYLLVGLPQRHPLVEAVAKRSQLTIRSTVYHINWRNQAEPLPGTNGRGPHLEIATL